MIDHFVSIISRPSYVLPLSYESGPKLHSFVSVSFVPFLEVFPSLPAYAAWYGSVVVPVPLKVFTYSALKFITGETPPSPIIP